MSFDTLVQTFADRAASGDGVGLASLFTEDGVYDDYFFGPQKGRPAIAAMLAHFAEGGTNFRWEFFDLVTNDRLGYASYRFSYKSKYPAAKGARVVFDGIGRFERSGPLLTRYSEVFDRGMALAQQAYDPVRIAKICNRYADALKARPEWAGHISKA
jgi:hypothetical protein